MDVIPPEKLCENYRKWLDYSQSNEANLSEDKTEEAQKLVNNQNVLLTLPILSSLQERTI